MDPLKDVPVTIGHHNLVLHHLLADLPGGQEMLLLHVVDCEVCRAEIGKCFSSRPGGKRAAKLAERVRKLPDGQAAVALVEARAGNLAGNAQRQLGRFEEAEERFAEAGGSLAFLAGLIPEKVTFWCYLGLLRWEQGKLAEAEPLLRQAARGAGELALPEREGDVRVLLGLLCLERGETERAVRLLQAGRVVLAAAPDKHPWLFLRAGLGLACCLAGGNDALARRVFEETLPHYALAGEAEEVRLRWLEGKLTARFGRRDEGTSLLARAWRLFLAEPSLGEATLCFLDLAAVLADAKRGEEVPALLAEMEAALAAWGGDPHEDLRDAVGEITTSICKKGRERRRAVAAEASFTMRRLFRARGHRIEPLPSGGRRGDQPARTARAPGGEG